MVRGWFTFYGFRRYVGRQSLINSSSTADVVFCLKLPHLVSKPLYGCVDLIILISDLAHCLKKRILVSSGHGSQSRTPRAVQRFLRYVGETPVTHKQLLVYQLRVPEAQWVGVEGKPSE